MVSSNHLLPGEREDRESKEMGRGREKMGREKGEKMMEGWGRWREWRGGKGRGREEWEGEGGQIGGRRRGRDNLVLEFIFH